MDVFKIFDNCYCTLVYLVSENMIINTKCCNLFIVFVSENTRNQHNTCLEELQASTKGSNLEEANPVRNCSNNEKEGLVNITALASVMSFLVVSPSIVANVKL